LQESLYAEASLGNPVDVVATAGADHYYAAADTLLKEDGVDMVLIFFVTAPFTDTDAIAARLKEACDASDKPVVIVVETMSTWYGLIDKLRLSGIPVYEFAEDGARALAAMADYAALRAQPREDPPQLKVDRSRAQAIIAGHTGKGAYLPQLDAFALLSAYGIPVPKVAAVGGKGDLAGAAAQVGYPCVLKVDAASVVHKSDAGGVVLGLQSSQQLGAAFTQMTERFAGQDAGYLLMEQKPTGHQVIIGAKAAPGLGSLVLFGLGGVFVEVMKDVVVAVAPLSRPESQQMLRGIKGFPLLEGMRGQPGADLAVLEELLLRASQLAADFPQIEEMDLNPVLVYPAGTAPAAVDVRIKVS
jgi:acetyltransferase